MSYQPEGRQRAVELSEQGPAASQVRSGCGFAAWDERVSDSLCAGAWFTSSPRIGRGKPRLVG